MARLSCRKSTGYASLAPMPPTVAAARKTYSGALSAKKRSTEGASRRSTSARVRRIRFACPRVCKARTMADPTSPRWPATKIRLSLCMGLAAFYYLVARLGERPFLPRQFQIMLDHHLHQFLEGHCRFPAQPGASLGGIPAEMVDFRGAEVALFDLDIARPVQVETGGGEVEKFADRMRDAGSDDVIIGAVLLQHPPHRFDVVPGVTPIAAGQIGRASCRE